MTEALLASFDRHISLLHPFLRPAQRGQDSERPCKLYSLFRRIGDFWIDPVLSILHKYYGKCIVGGRKKRKRKWTKMEADNVPCNVRIQNGISLITECCQRSHLQRRFLLVVDGVPNRGHDVHAAHRQRCK